MMSQLRLTVYFFIIIIIIIIFIFSQDAHVTEVFSVA